MEFRLAVLPMCAALTVVTNLLPCYVCDVSRLSHAWNCVFARIATHKPPHDHELIAGRADRLSVCVALSVRCPFC
jgi:hypothetical protein